MRALVAGAVVLGMVSSASAQDAKPPIMLHITSAHLKKSDPSGAVALFTVKNETDTAFQAVIVTCVALNTSGELQNLESASVDNVDAGTTVYGEALFDTQIPSGDQLQCRVEQAMAAGPTSAERRGIDKLLGHPPSALQPSD